MDSLYKKGVIDSNSNSNSKSKNNSSLELIMLKETQDSNISQRDM